MTADASSAHDTRFDLKFAAPAAPPQRPVMLMVETKAIMPTGD